MVTIRHVYHFVSLFTGTEVPGGHSTAMHDSIALRAGKHTAGTCLAGQR